MLHGCRSVAAGCSHLVSGRGGQRLGAAGGGITIIQGVRVGGVELQQGGGGAGDGAVQPHHAAADEPRVLWVCI